MNTRVLPGDFYWQSSAHQTSEGSEKRIEEMARIFPYVDYAQPQRPRYVNAYFQKALDGLEDVIPDYKPGMVFWCHACSGDTEILRVFGMNDEVLTMFKLLHETS